MFSCPVSGIGQFPFPLPFSFSAPKRGGRSWRSQLRTPDVYRTPASGSVRFPNILCAFSDGAGILPERIWGLNSHAIWSA